MSNKTIEKYITDLEKFQSQLKDIDREYSDKVMYAIRDKIVTLIICRYTPNYKFTKAKHARDFVVNLVTEPLYVKLEIYDSQWRRMFNEHINTYNKHPYVFWVKLRNTIRSMYGNPSDI